MSLRSVGITRGRLDARRVRHLLERMAKPPDPNDPHAVLQDALDAMLRDRPFASTAEVQSFLEAEVRALTVNAALSPNDIGDPEYMHNAVALLTTLRDDGPAKATAAGNLSRDFVARMLPRMRFREGISTTFGA